MCCPLGFIWRWGHCVFRSFDSRPSRRYTWSHVTTRAPRRCLTLFANVLHDAHDWCGLDFVLHNTKDLRGAIGMFWGSAGCKAGEVGVYVPRAPWFLSKPVSARRSPPAKVQVDRVEMERARSVCDFRVPPRTGAGDLSCSASRFATLPRKEGRAPEAGEHEPYYLERKGACSRLTRPLRNLPRLSLTARGGQAGVEGERRAQRFRQ